MDKDEYLHRDYSPIKKNGILPFAAWMDLEGIIVSQSDNTT